jgi:hypothetical protein
MLCVVQYFVSQSISFSALKEVSHVRWSKTDQNIPNKNILNNPHPISSLVLSAWHGVDRLFAFFYDCALWLSATIHANARAPTDSKLEETTARAVCLFST